MKGLTSKAQEKIDNALDELGVKQCEIISAVFEAMLPSEIEGIVRARYKQADQHKQAKLYKRRTTSGARPYSSKYGFGQMELGKRHLIEYGRDVSSDQPLQAARAFAKRWALEYGYERVHGRRALYVWFFKPGQQPL